MHPSLSECVGTLYAEGLRRFRVVPVFFGSGGHLKKDLPELARNLRAQYKDIDVVLEPPVGEQGEVIRAIARAIAP